MRGNASLITAIVAIILVIALLIPLVMMGREWNNMLAVRDGATERATSAATNAANLEKQVNELKDLIGREGREGLEDFVALHAETMEKFRPGEDVSTQSYHEILTSMLGDLESTRRDLHKARQETAVVEEKFNEAYRNYSSEQARKDNTITELNNRFATEQRQFISEREGYDRQLREGQEKLVASLSSHDRIRRELTDRAELLELDNTDIRSTNQSLAALLEEVRNPSFEHPAGKIISIDQQTGVAFINLGAADGLLVRTMFSVYHSGITGLSFRSAPTGQDAVYCDVCMREVSRDTAKASVEVSRILGPHRAEVRILDDVLTDPIMVGDVIYSPIWKPGQKLRFALTAGMNLPGSGIDSGTEAVRRLIVMNGGVVDCWIDETAEDGEYSVIGSISDLTNFIVVSDESNISQLPPAVAFEQEVLLESARNRAIKIISLGELLNRMGWRPMTPIHVFGAGEYMPEMRVSPVPQASVRYSDATVSPLFTPDNPNARVDSKDTTSVRDSGGIVSPLFNQNAPPPPTSGGRTSDLFRPRSPQAD